MVFHPPNWAPDLPELPDSITVEEFINNETYGRHPFASSRSPFTCGITGLSRSAASVARRTDLLARAVGKRLGFSPNQDTAWDRVVAIFSLNTIDYVPLTHAIHRLSGIVIPIGAASSLQEIEYQLRSSDIKAIFTCLPLLDTARQAARNAAIPDDCIFLLPLPGVSTEGVVTVDDLVAQGSSLPRVEPLRWVRGQGARQPAYLCHSSGTSGLPKAIMVSHLNVIAVVKIMSLVDSVPRKQLGIKTQVALGALPFSHIYGLVLVTQVGQYRGDEIVILPRFELAATLEAIQRHRIEQLYVVPPMMIQMIRCRDKCAEYDLSSIRWVLCGAAPLGSEVMSQLQGMYPAWKIGQAYGESPCLSETCGGTLCSIETDCLPGSSGSLVPGTIAKIIDAQGDQVTQYDVRGELLVQSPSVVLGYLDNERANAETFLYDDHGRWLRTGDEVLARKSSNGHDHFVVTDRIKELIKVKGFQVAPAELEAHLLHHPFVSDCAVISVHDDRAGEAPKALVVKSREASNQPDVERTLLKHVQDHKAEYKWLSGGIEFIESVPRSASGKILRRLLRDRETQRRKTHDAKL
ncbi:hypothetical protein L249_6691 [Ophiocordyceps polyrhachis-furcata BCC 54312]|uniref:AMP-dependent synthetase/ligase domain-containing protein n=1 Tax=Ophiocordyceps polyrhachis-furcata BCC 54312 TaxID=1330021 RepID=A0A367LLG0_9HYPO|nr:hypothetical protein L249_6691 [Ophiocordyceps polyrhachis-furcata BCC 54312]